MSIKALGILICISAVVGSALGVSSSSFAADDHPAPTSDSADPSRTPQSVDQAISAAEAKHTQEEESPSNDRSDSLVNRPSKSDTR